MKPKIAFIVSQFPCYDEAFILREIYAISKETDILIFSLKQSKDKIVHEQAQELMPRVVSVPFLFSAAVLGAHIKMFFCRPIRYLRALSRLISGNLKSPEFLLKNLALLPKSVYLSHLIQKEKITHLHAYWATYPASVAMIASEITGVPYSFTGHAHDIYLDTTHLAEKIRRASFVTTCTQQNERHLIKIESGSASPVHGEDRNGKILVNFHGVDLEKFYVNGKVRNQVFEILSVGTLQSHKGFQYLIPALAILRDRRAEFKCTIIGGGSLESDLRKHIRLLNLEPFIAMTGPLKQSEVLPYYKRADLLVLMAQPEWHWGIPNVLVEALAAKTPVVTTRFGSVEELVKEGETGLLVPSKDPVVLADTIEKLLRDDSLRRRLAEMGYERVVRNFDLKKNVEAFLGKLCHEDAALIA